MRPQKRKVKKLKKKAHKKRKVHITTHKPCCIHNVENSDFDSINQIIRDHKYQLKDVKNTWKVVPKDSCEVYKDRRKRQDQSASERESGEQNDKDDTNADEKPRAKRRVNRKPLKRDSRGRFLPASSKCSCCTRSNTDTDYSRSEAAYDD